MSVKWRFWEAWSKKANNPCRQCQCRDCDNNLPTGCAMGVDQTQFCGKIERRPAHSYEYIRLKNEFDRMHNKNNPETLAVYELIRRAYRAGNMRLIKRDIPKSLTSYPSLGPSSYTFYSPLLTAPVYIKYHTDSLCRNPEVRIKMANSIWVNFGKDSLAFKRAYRLMRIADSQIEQQASQERIKLDTKLAEERARQKEELMQLLADVRTRSACNKLHRQR